jgi:hypothetical protein
LWGPTADARWRAAMLAGFPAFQRLHFAPARQAVGHRRCLHTNRVQTDSVFLEARILCMYTQRCCLCHPLCACRPWMNVLLLAAPFALIGYGAGWSNGVVFAFALLAIAPFAERLGFVTEQLAFHTNETREWGL